MSDELKPYSKNETFTEIKLDKAIQNFLERDGYESFDVQNLEIEQNEDLEFINVAHISYDRSKDNTDMNLIDFQQLLSALASKTKKFIYMIENCENGVNLFIGTLKLDGSSFLKDTFEGIYSGSESNQEQPSIDEMGFSKAMMGVPSLKRDSDKEFKQSLEKIMFPLQGKKFRIVVVAESYDNRTIKDIISNYQNLGSELHRLVKQSKNIQKSDSNSEGITLTRGSSESSTEGISESASKTKGSSSKATSSIIGSMLSTVIGAGVGFAVGGPAGAAIGVATGGFVSGNLFTKTENESTTNSASKNYSRTNSTNESTSTNTNSTKTDTLGITFDEINKSAEYCESLIDKYIERFQKGLNHGMWNTSLYIQSEDEVTLSELEHTLKSVYSGDETYFEAIRFSENLSRNDNIKIQNLPMLYFDKSIQHPIHNSFSGFSTAINTEELSILSALPNSDIDGVSVSKISSFGLTQAKNIDKYNSVEIGNILNKKKKTAQRFRLSYEALNSHLFVSGITGSGKSNTIKHILTQLQEEHLEHKIPFLVIEPAKSEYKHLIARLPNLQIFRPGAKDDIFKFNPFIFDYSRSNSSMSLTKHVDMLKTTFSSAFPMYGPMAYILEDAIYKIYEDKGWSFITEDNPYFTDSNNADIDRKSLLFPNMVDLRDKIESVVEESGYAGELDSNIKAALKTRINNLTIGTKGRIFNSRHSLSSEELFEKPTIIELSNISDDDEKSFLMGLLLNKLYQHREEQGGVKQLRHITVVEEAHRLLPNISFDKSSEEASSKAKAVETFTNILAEIRAYGEGVIIADQIASKLHPDVIKNTNIKILQRTMDREDRELVGNAINLTDDQMLDIAELKAGEAIVHNKDVHQAFMVKIDEIELKEHDKSSFQSFYKSFLEKYDDYQYELIYEKKFYIEPKDRIDIYSLDRESLRRDVVKLLNAVLVDNSNLTKEWDNFISTLHKKVDNKNIYFYLFIEAFTKLNFISNIQYYRDIDAYLDVHKSFLRLIHEIISDNRDGVVDAIKKVKASFAHRNIKVVYPSMKYYQDEDIEYTLLLLENITSNEEIYEYVNETMKADTPLNDRFDKILQKIFKTISPQLRHSIGAIRSGRKEIDFTNIVSEGF